MVSFWQRIQDFPLCVWSLEGILDAEIPEVRSQEDGDAEEGAGAEDQEVTEEEDLGSK